MVKRGDAPAYFRVGRQRRWDLKVVEAWIAERSTAASEALGNTEQSLTKENCTMNN